MKLRLACRGLLLAVNSLPPRKRLLVKTLTWTSTYTLWIGVLQIWITIDHSRRAVIGYVTGEVLGLALLLPFAFRFLGMVVRTVKLSPPPRGPRR